MIKKIEKNKESEEGNYKPPGVKYHWVKQLIPKRQWNNFYSGNTSYCLLETIEDDPVVGFLIVHPDERCKPCTDEDLRKIDLYRRANNIRPFPTEEV